MANAKPKLYLIPGMGADGRLFEALMREGLDFEALEFVPALPQESLKEYALRLAQKIDQSQPFIVGGVSLGGIMAGEIALALGQKRVVLISSIKHSPELPPYFKLARFIPIYKLFSGGFLKRNGPRASHRTLEPWQIKILRDLRTDADDSFIEWAIDALVHWRRKGHVDQVFHIHGTRDFMLPGIFVGERIKVKGGRHVMVVTHAQEIVPQIQAFLEKN